MRKVELLLTRYCEACYTPGFLVKVTFKMRLTNIDSEYNLYSNTLQGFLSLKGSDINWYDRSRASNMSDDDDLV